MTVIETPFNGQKLADVTLPIKALFDAIVEARGSLAKPLIPAVIMFLYTEANEEIYTLVGIRKKERPDKKGRPIWGGGTPSPIAETCWSHTEGKPLYGLDAVSVGQVAHFGIRRAFREEVMGLTQNGDEPWVPGIMRLLGIDYTKTARLVGITTNNFNELCYVNLWTATEISAQDASIISDLCSLSPEWNIEHSSPPLWPSMSDLKDGTLEVGGVRMRITDSGVLGYFLLARHLGIK